jgi:CHU_C Type IX secretion signal domain
MENQEHIFDRIDSYINGEMNSAERAQFEHDLSSDSTLKATFEATKASNALFFYQEGLELKKDIKKLISEKKRKTKLVNGSLTTLGLILLGTATFLYFKDNSDTIKKVEKSNPSSKNTSTETIQTNSSIPNAPIDTNTNIAKSLDSNPEKKIPILDKTPSEICTQDDSKPEPGTTILTKEQKPVMNQKEDVKPSSPTTPQIATNACEEVEIKASITSKACDFDLSNGSINIKPESINGGKSPYKYSLDNKEKGSSFVFYNQKSGVHKVKIYDANNCESQLFTVHVAQTNCLSEYPKTFHIQRESIWEIPYNKEANQEATFSLYNEGGKVVYDKKIDSFENLTWDGISINGSKAPIGIYHFSINYSKGDKCTGSVTVFE